MSLIGIPGFLDNLEAELNQVLVEVAGEQSILPEEVTFVEWCEGLGERGMLVDGKPFRLDDRPALRWIYTRVPTTREEAKGWVFACMKGAQTGLTVFEMLFCLWCTLKFAPCWVGSYVPDMTLAGTKSSERFMAILRKVPEAYDRLLAESAKRGSAAGKEGNVLTRSIGASKVFFLWTSGKISTESNPFDVLTYDEVQGMTIADIEKTDERLSASEIKAKAFISTAMFPDADIDYLYKRGRRYRFHTQCKCHAGVVLDEEGVFPNCIAFNSGQYQGAPIDDYVYRCPTCDSYIPDTQIGEWVAEIPDARYDSVQYPQTLSRTVSPREMIEKFSNSRDMENFYRRKLGRPYIDPSRVPVTISMLEACAAEGVKIGLQWKKAAKNTFMGIDQMGAFNVVLIKERLSNGKQALIHAEMIYSNDPFSRCDQLMWDYGVQVCVVETLPNYNDAKRFAQRHKGKVFLAGYQDIKDDMLTWGDVRLNRQDRKSNEEARDQHTVMLDQYKCMQVAMMRISSMQLLFPDPDALVQEARETGIPKPTKVLRDVVFIHFTKTALVAELINEEEKKYRRKVIKIGIDPHFSYANMLCDVAWARAFGTGTFILPDPLSQPDPSSILQHAPQPLPVQIEQLPPGMVCGRCSAFDKAANNCTERNLIVRPQDAGCPLFAAVSDQ